MVLALVASALLGQTPLPQQPTGEDVYHDFRAQPLEYVGPASEDLDTENLTEVAIGWFGPSDPDHPLHGDLWTAANLAVEDANEAGGLHGLPVRLVARWSENPWGTGISQLARMVHEEEVRAVLGSVDGPGTHLAEQIVVKARLPLVSPVSTDESVNLAGVPWMFSLAPGDHLWTPRLIEGLLDTIGDGRFVLLASTDHDSRLATREILEELASRDRGPALRVDLQPAEMILDPWLPRLEESSYTAVLVLASATDSATLVRALREGGFSGPVFGGPQFGSRAFLESAGDAAEGVLLPLLYEAGRGGAADDEFARTFHEGTGAMPDWGAAHTYDATRLLLESIRRAGLSRAAIRQALVELSPWQGVTGIIEWDATGQNQRPVTRLATIRGGSLVPK